MVLNAIIIVYEINEHIDIGDKYNFVIKIMDNYFDFNTYSLLLFTYDDQDENLYELNHVNRLFITNKQINEKLYKFKNLNYLYIHNMDYTIEPILQEDINIFKKIPTSPKIVMGHSPHNINLDYTGLNIEFRNKYEWTYKYINDPQPVLGYDTKYDFEIKKLSKKKTRVRVY